MKALIYIVPILLIVIFSGCSQGFVNEDEVQSVVIQERTERSKSFMIVFVSDEVECIEALSDHVNYSSQRTSKFWATHKITFNMKDGSSKTFLASGKNLKEEGRTYITDESLPKIIDNLDCNEINEYKK